LGFKTHTNQSLRTKGRSTQGKVKKGRRERGEGKGGKTKKEAAEI
jgi:hypothetical protein